MSTCIADLQAIPNKASFSQRIESKDDLTTPIQVSSIKHKKLIEQEADTSFNNYVMRQRESVGKRTLLRINIEVYCRKSAKNMGFSRLRNRHLIVSLPGSEQAELLIDAVFRVVESIHGKLLVKA